MRPPRAVPTATPKNKPDAPETAAARVPQAFAPAEVRETADVFADGADPRIDTAITPEPRPHNRFWWRLVWGTGGLLVSLALGLAAERLISDLFARYEALGWIGIGVLALFILAVVVLTAREMLALFRLANLDRLRDSAQGAIAGQDLERAQAIGMQMLALYRDRPDMAQARENYARDSAGMLDAEPLLHLAERTMIAPLDRRAKALVAASARRVALVTTVSPRALIDIAFVLFESFRLARILADLYGARPGLFGFWRLVRAILAHLAVTGGLEMTDGVVEQLIGQSMASKISARLGEGLVNGLMTVRVGIAAIAVVRPLPHLARRAPKVADFVPELVKVTQDAGKDGGKR